MTVEIRLEDKICKHMEVVIKRSRERERYTLRILPPATPPFISSTSNPGLLTSKDRITIIFGGDTKFLSGIGIFLTMYSHTTSMLYFSCAETGTIGAPSATVFCKQM